MVACAFSRQWAATTSNFGFALSQPAFHILSGGILLVQLALKYGLFSVCLVLIIRWSKNLVNFVHQDFPLLFQGVHWVIVSGAAKVIHQHINMGHGSFLQALLM
jgi:hypothetical protein